eukprot:s182_g26.t1
MGSSQFAQVFVPHGWPKLQQLSRGRGSLPSPLPELQPAVRRKIRVPVRLCTAMPSQPCPGHWAAVNGNAGQQNGRSRFGPISAVYGPCHCCDHVRLLWCFCGGNLPTRFNIRSAAQFFTGSLKVGSSIFQRWPSQTEEGMTMDDIF